MEEILKKIEKTVRTSLPHLMELEKYQVFNSKIYGDIVATQKPLKTKDVDLYSVYGFDVKEGLPRSCFYYEKNKIYNDDLTLVGKDIYFTDILYYFKTVKNQDLYINIFTGLINLWDYKKPELKYQPENVIEFINKFI